MNEEQATLLLSEAEQMLRQDQPGQAFESLESQRPEDLHALQRPQWYWLVGWALTALGRPSEAMPILEEGLRLAEDARMRAAPAQREQFAQLAERLRYFLGSAYSAANQTRVALEQHLLGLAAIQQGIITDPELKLLIYKGAGNEYLALGQYQQAIAFYQQALKQTDTVENPRQHGLAYWGLGLAYQRMGDLFRAGASYREALYTLDQVGTLLLVTQVRLLLGQVLVGLKQFEAADSQFHLSLEAAQRLGDTRLLAQALGNLGSLSLAQGDPDQAIQAATEAARLAEQGEDRRSLGQLQLTIAAAYGAIHDPHQAEEAFKRAIAVAEQTSDVELIGQAHARYAEFLAEQERFQDAFEHMRVARVASAY